MNETVTKVKRAFRGYRPGASYQARVVLGDRVYATRFPHRAIVDFIFEEVRVRRTMKQARHIMNSMTLEEIEKYIALYALTTMGVDSE